MPLLLSNTEWKRISRHLEKKEQGNGNGNYVMSLTKASEEMKKKWPNSLENVKKHHEEMRDKRTKQNESGTEEFYKNYVMQKKKEHKQAVAEARLHMFKDKDAPKMLLSGLLTSEIHREWDRQVKFNQELREQAKRKENAYAAEQKIKYQEWKEEQRNKALKKLQEDTAFGNFIKEQARSLQEERSNDRAWEVELERIDNIKVQQQMEDIKNFEEAMRDKQKKNVMDAMELSLMIKRKKNREIELREQLDEKLRTIYINSKHKIDCMRKDKELQLKNERIRILEEISSRLEQGEEARNKKEQEMLEQAQKEHLQLEREKWEADRLRKQQLNEELKRLHEQTVSVETKHKHEVNTLHTWQMLNRVKNNEMTEHLKELKKEETRKKILKYRAELIAQWNERKELEAKELAERRYFYGEKVRRAMKETDKQFLDYANQIIEECIAKGRPLFPIEKVINDYKNNYSLNPMPEKTNRIKENFETSVITSPGPKDGVRNLPVRKSVQCKSCAPSLPSEWIPSNSEYQLRKCAKK